MHIQKIQLSEFSKKAVQNIIKSSNKATTIGQQTVMTNYYCHLIATSSRELKDFSRIISMK